MAGLSESTLFVGPSSGGLAAKRRDFEHEPDVTAPPGASRTIGDGDSDSDNEGHIWKDVEHRSPGLDFFVVYFTKARKGLVANSCHITDSVVAHYDANERVVCVDFWNALSTMGFRRDLGQLAPGESGARQKPTLVMRPIYERKRDVYSLYFVSGDVRSLTDVPTEDEDIFLLTDTNGLVVGVRVAHASSRVCKL